MKKLFDRLNYKRQCWLAVGIVLFGFVLARLTGWAIAPNVGWVLAGLLYIVHPLVPESIKWRYAGDERKMARDSRIAGAVVIVVGLITRFGV